MRPCINGCGRFTKATRCVPCEQQYQQQRNAERTQYQGSWSSFARKSIAEYRTLHGDICPGWRYPAHAVMPDKWTCDHDLGPMCRSCNSRKGATVDKEARSAKR